MNWRETLEEVASVLDKTLGDSDLMHIESDDELRERAPVQWACSKINRLLQGSCGASDKEPHCKYRKSLQGETPQVNHLVATVHHADKDELLAQMSDLARQLEKRGNLLAASLKVLNEELTNRPEIESIETLREENKRFRNGFANLSQALQEAPGLPLECLEEAELAKWTDIITGVLMAMGVLETTGKPQSPFEALQEAADAIRAEVESTGGKDG